MQLLKFRQHKHPSTEIDGGGDGGDPGEFENGKVARQQLSWPALEGWQRSRVARGCVGRRYI